MVHQYQNTYDNMYHMTTESILPLIDHLHEINPGDIVQLPDFAIYPVELIKKILPNNIEIQLVKSNATIQNKVPSYLSTQSLYPKVRQLCSKLLEYIPKKDIAKPSIYMSFRLHNRVWRPLDNIQKLVNCLKDRYTIVLSLNPIWEKITDVPNIDNVIKVYNLSYEEQLSYAYSTDYSIHMLGAGMIFPLIVNLPSVVLAPCECSINYPIGPYFHNNENIITLSDKRIVKEWNCDVVKVSVDNVLTAFEKLAGKK